MEDQEAVASASQKPLTAEPFSKRQKKEVVEDSVVVKLEGIKNGGGNAAATSGNLVLARYDNDDDSTPTKNVQDLGGGDCEGNDDGEVEVMEPPPKQSLSTILLEGKSDGSCRHDDDDDVEMLGSINETRLPHLRQHCTPHKFVMLHSTVVDNITIVATEAVSENDVAANVQRCELCYCYVCDAPAKDCPRWTSSTNLKFTENHCHAVDGSGHWKTLRDLFKTNHHGDLEKIDQEFERLAAPPCKLPPQRRRPSAVTTKPRHLPDELRQGAFSPDDADAAPYRHLLTKCHKCGWYSNMEDRIRKSKRPFRVQGTPIQWCHKCGRVASEHSFLDHNKKIERPSFREDPASFVFLGTRVIPFRIKAHDPRKMKRFQTTWSDHEGSSAEWIYDEAEMEHDVFRYRIGNRPSLQMILKSIPVVREDLIPEDGVFVPIDDKRDERQDGGHNVLEDDTDAILVDRKDRILLQELISFQSIGWDRPQKDSPIDGDITAGWQSDKRCGEFCIRVFLSKNLFEFRTSTTFFVRRLNYFLASWFNLPPSPISRLAGQIRATKGVVLKNVRLKAPPFFVGDPEHDALVKMATDEMNRAVDAHNNLVDESLAKLSLVSSQGGDSCLGGIASLGNDFSSLLQSCFKERLPDDVESKYHEDGASWFSRACGIASCHRSMRETNVDHFPSMTMESYIREEELPLCANLQDDCNSISGKLKRLPDVLFHLEDLGYQEAPFVEGLDVELLPFQRQTLQWALDREKIVGGLQSLLWGRLPVVEDSKYPDVYYSPALQRFCTSKPRTVRGGIIADEMGLGKTVVSIALILQNPAPDSLSSGTNLLNMSTSASGESGWDLDANKFYRKRGSVLCRGTLVVCPVSLIGQWVEEARSKLKDPGLVYTYHGGNRKRDAFFLAQHSIVVTTYAILASEKYNKQSRMQYESCDSCTPCEKIRWWRIICDESHVLTKQGSQQHDAVMSLVGQHKWAVTGTPWTTSLSDLTCQLKFIGLDYVDDIVALLQKTFEFHFGNNNALPVTSVVSFLRAIMIRHSQKQRYRKCSRELMSLPEKTERTVLVEFSEKEAEMYAKLERTALDAYLPLREKVGSAHYFHSDDDPIFPKLNTLRQACAGVLLGDNNGGDPDDIDGGSSLVSASKALAGPIFQSKFFAVVEELKRVRSLEPYDKSLVFSQHTSSLEFLNTELAKKGFRCQFLLGTMSLNKRLRALEDFKSNPRTTVFLLSMGSGGKGINLTEASRVFLLEPMVATLEAQAIGRVYRLGQTKPVEVLRLIMKDTVESRNHQFEGRLLSLGKMKHYDILLGIDSKQNETPDNENEDHADGLSVARVVVESLPPDRASVVSASTIADGGSKGARSTESEIDSPPSA